MKSNKPKIYFRVNASQKIGLGHVVRCLSIIQIIDYKFNCIIIINNAENSIINIIKEVCEYINLNIEDTFKELEMIRKIVKNDEIFVIDGYEFDTNYQIEIKKIVKKLVIIDDLSNKQFFTDVIINHGDISALPSYQVLKQTQIFSGLKYLIVRPDFIKAALTKKIVSSINTIFICMGGADPYNITTKAIIASAQCDFIEKIIVVIGSLYENKSNLFELISKIKNVSIELVENASGSQMVNLIEQSQIAISTASTIALEICCVKSALICGTIVENQNAIHSQLIKNGCCITIDNWANAKIDEIKNQIFRLNDLNIVKKIIKAQSKCFDGKSPQRILNIFQNLAA